MDGKAALLAILTCILLGTAMPAGALAQQGEWHRFGWNPPVVSVKDTNGSTWTFFGAEGVYDSSLIARPIAPATPYRFHPYSRPGGNFGLQFHLDLDFSLHYKNGLLQRLPIFYAPWIYRRRSGQGYFHPFRTDTTWRK